MKTLIALFIIGASSAWNALAAREINIRAMALDRGADLPELFVKVAGGYEPLAFSHIQPGEVFQTAIEASTLSLFKQITSDQGSISYDVAENIRIPAEAKGVLLLGWTGHEGPRYLAINDDFLSATYDNWLLVNAAPKDVAFRIGENNNPIIVNANSVTNYKLNVPEGAGVAVQGQAKWGDKVRTFYSTYWPVKAGERGIVIFFYLQNDRMALRRITDVLSKPEEKNSR